MFDISSLEEKLHFEGIVSRSLKAAVCVKCRGLVSWRMKKQVSNVIDDFVKFFDGLVYKFFMGEETIVSWVKML